MGLGDIPCKGAGAGKDKSKEIIIGGETARCEGCAGGRRVSEGVVLRVKLVCRKRRGKLRGWREGH